MLTLPVAPEIAPLFPHTAHLSAIELSDEKNPASPTRVGVIFSGGPAAGGHNVLAGLINRLSAASAENRLFGFLGGPAALLTGEMRELNSADIAPFQDTGGFELLGTGRTKIETPDQFEAVLKTMKHHAIDVLVIIGGDDSNTNAASLAEYFLKNQVKTCVIGVPKTIDGDIQNPFVPITFGFDTAAKVYSEMIGNLAHDALSIRKYFHFVRLMGRSASHLTLECALKTHPNFTLISEEKKPFQQVVTALADFIAMRHARGIPYGVIVVPEGLLEMMPNLPELRGERDTFGNLHLSSIETEKVLIDAIASELKRRAFQGAFAPVAHFYGYEGRCSRPSKFDAEYSYRLGETVARLALRKKTGLMAYVKNLHRPSTEWVCGGVPFAPLLTLRSGMPVITRATVNVHAAPFLHLQQHRLSWMEEDCYKYPGPIQFNDNSFPEILKFLKN